MADGDLGGILRHIRRLLGVQEAGKWSDGQLVDQFVADRNEAAFEAIMRQHGPMVLGLCRRILKDSHAAEDAYQATFLVLVRKAGAIARRDSVGSWLYGVAQNIALKMKAKSDRRRKTEKETDPMNAEKAKTSEVQKTSEVFSPELDEELGRLPEKYRAPVVLCYLEGKSNEEAAKKLQWPTGTVKTRLAQARNLLRSRLTKRGLALSEAALIAGLTQNASAAVPASLLTSTLKAGILVAAGKAAGTISVPVAALIEGVIHEMFITKIKMLTAVIVGLTLIGTGTGVGTYQVFGRGGEAPGQGEDESLRKHSRLADARGDDKAKPEEKPKTEPAGVPLELRLVAKKDTYPLDVADGQQLVKLIAEAKKSGDFSKVPPPPAVDLAVEMCNTGDKELKVRVVGNLRTHGFNFELTGTGAVSGVRGLDHNLVARKVISLGAGKVHSFPIQSLEYGFPDKVQGAYWTAVGEYLLTATFRTEISPAPKDAKDAGQGFGQVVLTSKPLRLNVVDQDAPPDIKHSKAGTVPAEVTLEGKLIVKKDTYLLDLKGKTDQEFQKMMWQAKWGFPTLSESPTVDIDLEIRNTGNKELTIGWGGDTLDLVLAGPGAEKITLYKATTGQEAFAPANYPAAPVFILPGKSFMIPIRSLVIPSTPREIGRMVYWCWHKPGPYTLSAKVNVGVATITTSPATLKVKKGETLQEWKGTHVLKDNQIIRTPEDLKTAWEKAYQHAQPMPELPKVDFSKQMVILAAASSNIDMVKAEKELVVKMFVHPWSLGHKPPEQSTIEAKVLDEIWKSLGDHSLPDEVISRALSRLAATPKVVVPFFKQQFVFRRSKGVKPGSSLRPEVQQDLRAIQVLAKIASPEAREVLEMCAREVPDVVVWEARAALERLPAACFAVVDKVETVRFEYVSAVGVRPIPPEEIPSQWKGTRALEANQIIRTPEAWKKVWEKAHENVKSMPELPKVDFTKHLVLTASTTAKVVMAEKEYLIFSEPRGFNSKPITPIGPQVEPNELDSIWRILGEKTLDSMSDAELKEIRKRAEKANDFSLIPSDKALKIQIDKTLQRLAATPKVAVPFFREHFKPATPDAKRIDKLIADLDSDQFKVREAATKELEQMEKAAVPALEKARAAKPTLEVRKRLDQLLEKAQKLDEQVLAGRAIEVLEAIASPEAREVLEMLANGPANSVVTKQAQEALARLPVACFALIPKAENVRFLIR